MASSGGGGDGHRVGAQQRGGSGSDVSSSKKKQKDRANQESREAKRAAVAAAAVDGVLAEVKKDVFVDWKQNDNEVTVRLRCGDGVQRIDDIDTNFTDTNCNVSFPDGREWSCQLQEEIEASCSRVQYKEKGGFLHLIMHKKIPFHIWPSLKSNKKVKQAAASSEKVRPSSLQPHPPSSPSHGESRRSKAERGMKRCLKNKACDKAPADLAGVKSGASETTTRPAAAVLAGEPHPQEPSTKRPIIRLPKTTKGAEKEKLAAKSAAVNGGKATNGRSPQTPGKDTNSRAEERLTGQEVGPEVSSANRAQRNQSLNRSGVKAQVKDEQPRAPESTSPCLKPVCFNKEADSASGKQRECTNSEVAAKPAELSPEPGPVIQQQLVSTEAVQSHAAGLIQNSCDGEEKRDRPKEEPPLEISPLEAPEPMVNLQSVKNGSYEKGTDLMVVNVYIKGVCRDTARVIFREQDFTLIFQTSDVNFLHLHSDCGPNTVFRWQVKLRNLIQPEQCTYTFTPSRLDITLKKRHSQRWEGLLAPASQGAVGGAKVAVASSPACMDKSQPGSSQHSLPAKEEPPRVGEETAKAPKASNRGVEGGALDSVAPRSVSEHVAITKSEPAVTAPKPTCMVQPMTYSLPASIERHEEEEEKKVCLPGFTGLVNLGNTCFMNSVIQSLSNTRELRDYFHDRAFEAEINCSNPLGTGGRLAIGFAVLLRALWKGTHHAFQPSKLKAIVASKASQFTGYAQHDAQEFMAFLLDGLHEDLNRIQNKPYTETVDSDGRLDEVVAEEAWQRHKMRNDSFIVDLFQGQFKSKLVCPMCSKVSITFDPFLYLPVPLPQKQKVLSVFFFAKEPHKKPIKFLVSVSKENSSTAEVLESISRSVRVKPENLRIAEVSKNRFQRIFLPSQSLDTVSPSDMLFCFELLSKDLAKERVLLIKVHQKLQVPNTPISKCAACLKPPVSEEDKLKRCMRCYRVGYCNQVCQKTHWPSHKGLCRPNSENVGLPFMVSVPESRLSYARLAQLLEGYSRFSVNVFQPPFQSGRASPETPQSRVDLPPMTASSPEAPGSGDEAVGGSSSVGAADLELDSQSLADIAPASSIHPEVSDSLSSSRTKDSGFSESISSTSCCSLDPHAEKETSCEKTVRPEAAVTGYQHSSESASGHASQFYIALLDSNNKEQRLDEKEDALADLPEDATLELVWKNNERLKEYVLVSSKELEYEEDPGSLSETARAGHFTLEQCLNLFTKPEVLAPEEAWYCPKCQQHREASKQLLLWRLPNVLIIQLKRFSFRSFIWRDKINDMVDFPVRNLDLSKFCIGQKDDMQQPPIYDLYAVINHYGGMIGGHYTAYARLPSDKNSQRSDVGWRLFDDSTVTMVEESQVVTRYAYVLFYRRRNSPVERPPRFLRPVGADSPSGAGATASQASLIWRELEEEEEEGLDEEPRGLFRSVLRRQRNREEDYRTEGPVRRQRVLDHPDDYCVRYFLLGTLAAVLAVFVNLVYPFLFKARWS
ncbi:ubiquitin carboxyl-terminal hydrolase 19 isoform X1 [Oryzias latipes]|uniref:ubiquitin carboxyl-terminal hydrolase 19 isoform X1 n=1 Tax=Oryzias latipes TaxID=8090 RepID=UPI000CE184B4|nr:ubiquitin carboxyl-terminal hydrolase 19 isoform X1 [Oryzias latipes]XP_023812131.1 ubiquitin carboxyl-terminal hydrolase 19 isoform X1 [Oryzias latipes]XP_023812132.1 ubiquitin carboxyl-terminal hydrolase 19 isoform X1 [Oryzias latipes]